MHVGYFHRKVRYDMLLENSDGESQKHNRIEEFNHSTINKIVLSAKISTSYSITRRNSVARVGNSGSVL